VVGDSVVDLNRKLPERSKFSRRLQGVQYLLEFAGHITRGLKALIPRGFLFLLLIPWCLRVVAHKRMPVCDTRYDMSRPFFVVYASVHNGNMDTCVVPSFSDSLLIQVAITPQEANHVLATTIIAPGRSNAVRWARLLRLGWTAMGKTFRQVSLVADETLFLEKLHECALGTVEHLARDGEPDGSRLLILSCGNFRGISSISTPFLDLEKGTAELLIKDRGLYDLPVRQWAELEPERDLQFVESAGRSSGTVSYPTDGKLGVMRTKRISIAYQCAR
jgi:hypothetical protein